MKEFNSKHFLTFRLISKLRAIVFGLVVLRLTKNVVNMKNRTHSF